MGFLAFLTGDTILVLIVGLWLFSFVRHVSFAVSAVLLGRP